MAKMVKLTKSGMVTSLFNVDKILEVEAHGGDPNGLLSVLKLDTAIGVQEVPVAESYEVVEQRLAALDI